MSARKDCMLYIGTEDGLYICSFDGEDSMRLVGRGLQGNAVRSISIHPHDPSTALIGCGLRGWGLHAAFDFGKSFRSVGFEDKWVWDAVYHPNDSSVIWVGTEPPMLYQSEDNGATFIALEGINQLKSRSRWMFFHPPFFSGHLHGIAFHPEKPMRIFAGVEQGALVYSNDNGNSWSDTLIGYDLHRIAFDPFNPEILLAGAGEGLLQSKDEGVTWNMIPDMKGKYIHSICFDPFVAKRVFVYADEKHSPLYRSDDGGLNWIPIGIGLPAARPADNLVLHPVLTDVLFYGGDVAYKESVIFCSLDAGETWSPISYRLPKIWRMKVAVSNH